MSTIKPPSNAFPHDTTPDYYSSNSERRDSHDSGSLFYKFLQYRENFICYTLMHKFQSSATIGHVQVSNNHPELEATPGVFFALEVAK